MRGERAFYRLVYPLLARPELRIGGQSYSVVDLSEEGVRFEARGPFPEIGLPMEGQLQFKSKTEIDVAGIVVRVTPPTVALKLVRAIPLPVIMEEQRYLKRRFVAR
jgi:PilZ domain